MMSKIDSIPQELKQLKQWVCFKLVPCEKTNKLKKMPMNPNNGSWASCIDNTTWSDFETALNAVEKYKFDGIGIEFANEIFGIDLDNVIKNGKLSAEAREIVDIVNSYTEYSPSGNGLHILCKGEFSGKGKRKGNIEMYREGRFFTVTGNVFENRNKIEQRTEQAKIVFDKYLKDEPRKTNKDTVNCRLVNHNLSDDEIIRIASEAINKHLFKALWGGDTSGYSSPSEAEQALANILAFYSGGDFNRIDNLMKQSGLYREKWDRKDYKTATINKAISGCREFYGEKQNFNHKSHESKNSKFLDEDSLTNYLKENGISIRYNIIKKEIEIKGVSAEYNPETLHNDLPIILYDKLKHKFKRCDKITICDLLGVIAGKNRFNPIVEMLEKHSWDGNDRLKELFSILHISEEDTLSRTLIIKWLWQALSLVRNGEKEVFGADGILVLQGNQRIGKTTFVKKMAVHSDLCQTGLYLDNKDKDTFRRCCSGWIIELGEIETTFKSDLERLKAFITSETDIYRLPYGRSDQMLARRTSIIGTCNSEKFLIDPTGSRRFWTIPLTEIDFNRLMNFDSLQLWLQIEERTKSNRQGFRLTKDEQKELAKRNGKHEKLLRGQAEVIDILSKTNKNLFYEDITVSEFKESHITLKTYSVEQISTALNKMGVEAKTISVTIKGKRTTKKVRNLPIWKFEYG